MIECRTHAPCQTTSPGHFLCLDPAACDFASHRAASPLAPQLESPRLRPVTAVSNAAPTAGAHRITRATVKCIRMVETRTRGRVRLRVAERRDPACVSRHSCEMQMVPGHNRRVTVGKNVFRSSSAQRQPLPHPNHQRCARSRGSLTVHQGRRYSPYRGTPYVFP